MNRLTNVTNIIARTDGDGGRLTLHSSKSKAMELEISAADLELLTLKLIELSMVARQQAAQNGFDAGTKVTFTPVKVTNVGAVPLQDGDVALVFPVGAFTLAMALSSDSLQALGQQISQLGAAASAPSHTAH